MVNVHRIWAGAGGYEDKEFAITLSGGLKKHKYI